MSGENFAGRKLGRYELRDQLGSGGMGAVFRAFDAAVERVVAVKVLPTWASEGTGLERFQREARVVARLEHPNIVPLYDYGSDQGLVFVVMRLLNGGSLNSRLREVGSGRSLPSLGETRDILKQVADALQYAHQQGIIHRDIKPSNIMFDDRGVPYIVDFGIALLTNEAASRITAAGSITGSPAYMAPEQIVVDKVIGPATDQYSLGVLIYELLTGTQPFQSDSVAATIFKHIQELPAPPSSLREDIPPALDQVLMRSMAKDPADRFPTIIAFAEAFSGAIKGHEGTVTGFFQSTPSKSASPVQPVAPLTSVTSELTFVGVVSPSVDEEPPPLPLPESTGIFTFLELPETQLTVIGSGTPLLIGRSVRIESTSFTIGRSSACDLSLDGDVGVSRQHVRINFHDGSYFIEDLGASNGTFLNGKPLVPAQEVPLLFGASIAVGRSVIRFLRVKLDMPDLVGQVLDDRYEVKEEIAVTGKGVIYRAWDRTFKRDVAVKVLSPDLASYPGYQEQLEREAQTAVKLNHPHIVRIFDYNARGEYAYIVMQLLDGGSLNKDRVFSLEETAALLGQLASALDYAHDQGVVHSGIKLNSVVFDKQGQPYLTDFAIAQQVGDPEDTMLVGSPIFFAPEQWKNEAITRQTDQYGLGVLAYMLVTGEYPFDGQTEMDYRAKHLEKTPPLAHLRAAMNSRAAVPSAISDVLQKALAKNPKERYETVGQFAAAFAGATRPASDQKPEQPSVFISYRRMPSAMLATLIATKLQMNGISVFVDTRKLDGGGPFPTRLLDAIEKCDVFICLIAETTFESEWVQNEIQEALKQGKILIPVFQENYKPLKKEDMPNEFVEALLRHDGVHVFDIKNVYIDEAINHLTDMVKDTFKRDPH